MKKPINEYIKGLSLGYVILMILIAACTNGFNVNPGWIGWIFIVLLLVLTTTISISFVEE